MMQNALPRSGGIVGISSRERNSYLSLQNKKKTRLWVKKCGIFRGITIARCQDGMKTKTKVVRNSVWEFSFIVVVLLCFCGIRGDRSKQTARRFRAPSSLKVSFPSCRRCRLPSTRKFARNVPNETLIVGPGQGIRYAVVTLEGITKGKAVEREAVHEMDNLGCRFVPHVFAASVGQFVVFKNSDPILHTAHA